MSIKPIKMHLNQVIYKEGDDVKGMYLVLKGSVKYKKAVDMIWCSLGFLSALFSVLYSHMECELA